MKLCLGVYNKYGTEPYFVLISIKKILPSITSLLSPRLINSSWLLLPNAVWTAMCLIILKNTVEYDDDDQIAQHLNPIVALNYYFSEKRRGHVFDNTANPTIQIFQVLDSNH